MTTIPATPPGRAGRDRLQIDYSLNADGDPASCDFCGAERSAAYRYFCRPFTINDWHNGAGPDGDPREADWAACWQCAAIIETMPVVPRQRVAEVERRMLDPLAARAEQAARERTPSASSKLAAPSTARRERLVGFVIHRTGKRVFIGKCDICSTRGETVRWLYLTRPYTYREPTSGRSGPIDPEWVVCDTCSKAIDSGNRKHVVDRIAIGHTPAGAPPAALVRARTTVRHWVDEFYRHRTNQPRALIPDLPPRVEPPPIAPRAAQVALETQLTLLRWIEGSQGRAYIGSWNDRYSGERRSGRLARPNEIEVWAQALRYGETFYWEPSIAEAMRQAALDLHASPDVAWTLTPETLPAPQGFFYADVPFGEAAGHPLRALGWTLASDIQQGRQSPVTPSMTAMTVMLNAHGGGNPLDADGIVLTSWSETTGGLLRPSGSVVWPFGIDSRQLGFYTITTVTGGGDTLAEGRAEVFASMLAFIQQRIVVPSRRMGVSGATRKHVEREAPQHTPMVRVVALRRAAPADYEPPTESTGRHVNVTFRVRGFWRQQCHDPHHHAERGGTTDSGGSCLHQAVYVHAHMRGQGPLRMSRADVFDVLR